MSVDLADVPHPRDRPILVGHEAPARSVAEAARAGRLHHAWLIGGPEGIGKATLAYRIARRLLAPAAEHVSSADGLGTDPDDRTARQVAASAHPNLVVLERGQGDGEKAAPRTISVEQIRKALGLFTSTAADGGRRICIIDPVEDLTVPAANALLKTIEEPPAGALILIVTHAPHRVLPTIRSRCRKLMLGPLQETEVATVLNSLAPAIGEPDAALLGRAVALAEGSVRRALTMLDPARIETIAEVNRLLDRLPELATSRVLALGERLADRRRPEDFALALDAVQRWLALKVEANQGLGPARLAPLAEVCEKLTDAAREVETYNLDRRAFVMTSFGDLAEAVRRAA